MRTCRDCMNIFYPEDDFDHQDLCPTCRTEEVTIAMVEPPKKSVLDCIVDTKEYYKAGMEVEQEENKHLRQEAIEAADIIAGLTAELDTHKWISVGDRLPERGVLVRLYQNLPVPHEFRGMYDYLNGEDQFVDDDLYCVSVTHWKPIILPESN